MQFGSKRRLDTVEAEYERAIAAAAGQGDNDRAFELSVGFAEYRKHYQQRFTAER